MWNTGHALVKAKLKETGAPLAGEMSGHTFFKERWYGFDDGLYTGARLLEILSRSADVNAPLKALPNSPSTPELNIKMAEGEPFALIDKLKAEGKFDGADGNHHHRRRARRIRRRLRPGAPVEHDAGRRAALRGRQYRRAGAYPGGVPAGIECGVARDSTALLSLASGTVVTKTRQSRYKPMARGTITSDRSDPLRIIRG